MTNFYFSKANSVNALTALFISSFVLKLENENLTEGFNKSSALNISESTWEFWLLPLWQAEPLEQAIPFKSN